jgi:hypothetical protein
LLKQAPVAISKKLPSKGNSYVPKSYSGTVLSIATLSSRDLCVGTRESGPRLFPLDGGPLSDIDCLLGSAEVHLACDKKLVVITSFRGNGSAHRPIRGRVWEFRDGSEKTHKPARLLFALSTHAPFSPSLVAFPMRSSAILLAVNSQNSLYSIPFLTLISRSPRSSAPSSPSRPAHPPPRHKLPM